jgi:hypothetical protein
LETGPSGALHSLRTHVPFSEDICTRAARARRSVAHPLVPSARGRPRGRLGGRRERAILVRGHASDAAAWSSSKDFWRATPGAARAPAPGMHCRARGRRRRFVAAVAPATRQNYDGPPAGGPHRKTGGVLLSQALSDQVPSALRGLTSLFGMGRGVSPSPKPPEKVERQPLRGPSKLHSATRVSQKNPSSPRPISTGLLQASPPFQIRPINLVVYQGPYSL